MKTVLLIVASALFIIIGYIVYHIESDKSRIIATATFDASCDEFSPIRVDIKNGSLRMVSKTQFDILFMGKDHDRPFSVLDFETDNIIKPLTTYSACYNFPVPTVVQEDIKNGDKKYFFSAKITDIKFKNWLFYLF